MKWSLFGIFGKFHFTPKWGNMLDHFTHFGAILIKFRGELVKFTNNSGPNLPHDRIKLLGSIVWEILMGKCGIKL
jgi:hypothetical protein